MISHQHLKIEREAPTGVIPIKHIQSFKPISVNWLKEDWEPCPLRYHIQDCALASTNVALNDNLHLFAVGVVLQVSMLFDLLL